MISVEINIANPLHLSVLLSLCPYLKRKIWGFPKDCVVSQTKISDSRAYPTHIVLSKQVVKRFGINKTTFTNCLFKFHSTHYVIDDVFVNKYGCILWHDCWINVPYMTHYKITNGTVIKEFNEAIYLSNNCMYMYAHLFLDLFTPFILLPEDVKRRCVLVTGADMKIAAEIYQALGYDLSNLYQFPITDNYVKIKRMHTVFGAGQVNSHIGCSLQKLRALLKAPLKLDLMKPTRYIVFNREKDKSRHINNYNALLREIKTRFNNYTWEKMTQVPAGLNDTAKIWNSVKLVFGITGSTFANSIFMQNGTYACIQLANWYDTPAMHTCLSYGVKIYVSLTYKCDHYGVSRCLSNVNGACFTIQRALQDIEKEGNETLKDNITRL